MVKRAENGVNGHRNGRNGRIFLSIKSSITKGCMHNILAVCHEAGMLYCTTGLFVVVTPPVFFCSLDDGLDCGIDERPRGSEFISER